ncbi:MAG: hypothetical protein WD942_06690 [Dehalococcoidia bacterium]
MSTASSDTSNTSQRYVTHRIVPTERGDEIKELFVNNERPEFPEWFDRAYPIAIEKLGATSWVTVDPGDRIICHMAAFKAWFWVGDESVEGTLLCNLMTDRESRSFFPTVATIKRAVRDLRNDGTNFIYTNPINKGSIAVMRAGGLKKVGDENRYLLPLGHDNWVKDFACNMHLRARSLGQKRAVVSEVEPERVVEWTASTQFCVSNVTSRRYPEVYFMRWNSLKGSETYGFEISDAKKGKKVGAALLRRSEKNPKEAALITLRCVEAQDLAPASLALGLELRRRGFTRLNATALEDSPFAEGLSRGGFIRRKEPWTIVATAFTSEGQHVVDGLGSSDLEHIDVD